MSEKSAPEEKPLGEVTHYFGHISVVAIKLADKLAIGDTLHVRGHTTDLVFTVDSMQIEHESVTTAGPGATVGIKVTGKVRPGDHVYRV
jgi:putative protease